MIIVVGNGPSAQPFKNCLTGHTIFACNLAFLDWPVDHLVVKDRPAQLLIDEQHREQMPEHCWCPAKYLIHRDTYRFSDRWLPLEGVLPLNSGAIAIDLASRLYPDQPIYVLGFDSAIRPEQPQTTEYQYAFRQGHQITPSVALAHHQTTVSTVNSILAPVVFVSDTPSEHLATIGTAAFTDLLEALK